MQMHLSIRVISPLRGIHSFLRWTIVLMFVQCVMCAGVYLFPFVRDALI